MPARLEVVIAFIKPFQLEPVVDSLRRLSGFPGMSAAAVSAIGAHAAHAPREGERAEVRPLEDAVRLEVFCRAADRARIVDAITEAAHTGNPGDGKVFVMRVQDAQRIRTGKQGEAALSLGAAEPGAEAGSRRRRGL